MKTLQAFLLGACALGIGGAALAQPPIVKKPQMLRDANGAPVLVYGTDPGAMVIAEETFMTEPVIVAKEPAVRDSSGNPVADGTGSVVKSVSAAPMTEEGLAVYQVDRYFLVPSASAGSGSSTPSTVIVPAPGPVDPSSE